jgi:hypothetical protein
MHGSTCIFWAKLKPFSLQLGVSPADVTLKGISTDCDDEIGCNGPCEPGMLAQGGRGRGGGGGARPPWLRDCIGFLPTSH